jgi:iron complex outermembrane receptor protein
MLRRSTLAVFCVLSLALIATRCSAASGTTAAPDRNGEAFDLLQEEQTVTGATKRPQPLSETPSEVTVITAGEIHAMGYHTLADALRWVRGLYVTDDRNYSYLGIRGLQRPGDYNDKVLLALDGHTLNGNTFGDAALGDELGVDLEQVERIEVVRGPGSTLYGGYAVLAVVNIVTRQPHALRGVAVSGRGGGAGERRAWGRVAGARPGLAEITLSGSVQRADGGDFYYPEYDSPATRDGRARGVDGSDAWSISGSARGGGWVLTGKTNRRDKTIPTGSYGTVFGDPRNHTVDGHDFLELSRTQPVGDAVELNVRTYWDAARYHAIYVYDSGSGIVLNRDEGNGDLIGTEWRANWSAGARQVVTGGLEVQRHLRIRIENYDLEPYTRYVDREVRGTQGAAYVQDEFHLLNSLRLTAGSRVDAYQDFAPVVSPRVDLLWRASSATVLKVLAGTAFRAPSQFERYYDDGYSQVSNPGLEPERSASAEISIEHALGAASAELTLYGTRVTDLIDLVPAATPGLLQYRNRQQANARGVEAELGWVPSSELRVRLSAACQRTVDPGTGDELTNSPRWNAHALVVHDDGGPLTLGGGVRFLSSRRTLGGLDTDPAIVADARIGLLLGSRAEASLEVRNLFDARYGDPVSVELLQDQIVQNGRTAYFGLSWRQGPRP